MSELREYIAQSDEKGDLYISEEVLAMIAGAAAMEVEGVTGLPSANFGEQLLGKKAPLSRGITIVHEGDELVVGLTITIRYGVAVPELARRVQEAVMAALEATSGMRVRAVNLRVSGVTFDKSARQ